MDQLIKAMENMRIQFQDMKKETEDTKTELNETKIHLEKSKIQIEETKIQLEDTKTQLDEFKIQLDQSKIQREDCMVQLEESKTKISELGETLKSIEELGKTKDILANSMDIAPLCKLIEYAKKPCMNCNGPVYCLLGKVVGTRPMAGTKIMTHKEYRGKDKDGNLKVVGIYTPGYVNFTTISWAMTGETYDDADFCQFVYYCYQA